jgi:hypothetical protein
VEVRRIQTVWRPLSGRRGAGRGGQLRCEARTRAEQGSNALCRITRLRALPRLNPWLLILGFSFPRVGPLDEDCNLSSECFVCLILNGDTTACRDPGPPNSLIYLASFINTLHPMALGHSCIQFTGNFRYSGTPFDSGIGYLAERIFIFFAHHARSLLFLSSLPSPVGIILAILRRSACPHAMGAPSTVPHSHTTRVIAVNTFTVLLIQSFLGV